MADEEFVNRDEIIAQIQIVQDELINRGVPREYGNYDLKHKSAEKLKDLLEAKIEQLKTRKKWLGEN